MEVLADATGIRHRFARHDRAKLDRLQLAQAILPLRLVDRFACGLCP
jgi:hypothetical protein